MQSDIMQTHLYILHIIASFDSGETSLKSVTSGGRGLLGVIFSLSLLLLGDKYLILRLI